MKYRKLEVCKMTKSLNSSGYVGRYMDSRLGAYTFLGAVILTVSLILFSTQVTLAATPISDGCDIIVSQSTGITTVGCSTGPFPPGTACTSDAQCSLGSCDCKLGNLPGDVCCSRQYGSGCQGNDECASKVCTNGQCANTPAGNPKLINGDKCRTNQECASGNCQLRSPTKPYYVCKP